MSAHTVQTTIQIANSPEQVIEYLAEPDHRTLYLPSLKSITNFQGDAHSAGSSWNWCWSLLGVDFEGSASCTEYEPGSCFAFTTKGGIQSTFTYRATADGDGTSLTITVDFNTPLAVLALPGVDGLLEKTKQSETESIAQNLKTILDQ